MRPEWEHRFRPDDAYKKVRLGAKHLSNVFVNHYGLVIKNGLLVPGCAPNIGFSSYDEGFYYAHWRKAMEQMLVCRYGNSLPSKQLDDGRTYLLIHSPWFSYYFWITECIPRLLMVREHLKDLVLIYPESWLQLPFVKETLALFPELQWEVITDDVHLFVKDLIMPEVKPWTPIFIPEQVIEVRSLLLSGLTTPTTTPPTERVYISRAKAQRRRFTDEPAVESIMDEFGFRSVAMEELTFVQQVSLMQNTRHLTGLTGAGIINAHFLPEGSAFLDLSNVNYLKHDYYKFHFFKLCNIIKASYGIVFFEHAHDPSIDFYAMQNLIMDRSCLRDGLRTILTV